MSKTINLENKIPVIVKYLSWALIGFSTFVLFILSLLNATFREILAESPSQTVRSMTLLYGGQITNIISGIAMLHRKNWGRYLLVSWFAFQFVFTLVTETLRKMPLALYPDLLFCLTISWILFSRAANDYFHPENNVETLHEENFVKIDTQFSSAINPPHQEG